MIKVNEMALKTARDCRGLGERVDKAIKQVITANYGKYKVEKEDKEVWLILEGMSFLAEQFNKGLRVVGDWNTQLIEIYDYKQEQKEQDEIYLTINL